MSGWEPEEKDGFWSAVLRGCAAAGMKLDETSSRFILTAGASANQNGTALFEGVTVLFIAAAAGVKLSLMQQFFVAFACACAGLGSAGVAGASPSFITAMKTGAAEPVAGPSGAGGYYDDGALYSADTEHNTVDVNRLRPAKNAVKAEGKQSAPAALKTEKNAAQALPAAGKAAKPAAKAAKKAKAKKQ